MAVDTNLLVRLVTNDDPEQAERAAAAVDGGEGFFVPLSVSLELEWVLRGANRLGVDQVVRAFEGLLSVRSPHFEQEAIVREALHRHRQGLDFADALHRLGLEPPVQAP